MVPNPSHQVLIVSTMDDDLQDLSRAFAAAGDIVATVTSVSEARALHRRTPFEAILMVLPAEQDDKRISMIQEIISEANHPEVVVLAHQPTLKQAVSLTKMGAFDYMSANAQTNEYVKVVREAASATKSRRNLVTGKHENASASFLQAFLASTVPAAQEMARTLRSIASHAQAPALIWGETGSGKRVAAYALHQLGERAGSTLVHVNLIDENHDHLHEKLFGTAQTDGLFQAAEGGTLLIREIALAPRSLQEQLVEVMTTHKLPERSATPGAALHTRIVVTSSYPPERLLTEHDLLPELFEMLIPNTVRVLSLRERVDDIAVLVDVMLREVAAEAGRSAPRLMPEALAELESEKWYGNLRELHNVLTRLILLSDKDTIDITEMLRARGGRNSSTPPSRGSSGVRLRTPPAIPKRPSSSSVPRISGAVLAALDEPSRVERERIEQALELTNGHRERAAALLGMSRTTLWTRMRMLGVDYRRFRKSNRHAV